MIISFSLQNLFYCYFLKDSRLSPGQARSQKVLRRNKLARPAKDGSGNCRTQTKFRRLKTNTFIYDLRYPLL
jgi:hypothetical protein